MNQRIIINTDGSLEFIYSDDLRDLVDTGKSTIIRVSHVEPDDQGEWWASMWNSKRLGPYHYRQDALDAEIAYIYKELF